MEVAGPTRTFAASAGTPYAAEAAAEVYRAGGNAADAAVSAAGAASVTEPLFSSVGGGGVGGSAGRSQRLGGIARASREAHARRDARAGREVGARGVQAVQDERDVDPGRRGGAAANRGDEEELLQRWPGLPRG